MQYRDACMAGAVNKFACMEDTPQNGSSEVQNGDDDKQAILGTADCIEEAWWSFVFHKAH